MLELRDVMGKWKKHTVENWNLRIDNHTCIQVYGEKAEFFYHMLLQHASMKKGNLYWKGKPFFFQKEKIAWISSKDYLLPYLTVYNYIQTLCSFYDEFDEAWCFQMAEQKGMLYKKIKQCTKEEKAYLTVICSLSRKAELLISDCDFEEYADYKEWQELFSNVYYDCMILQIAKEKKEFWWKKADVYYHAEENGFTKEIVEEKPKEQKKIYREYERIKDEVNEEEILNTLWGGEDDDKWKRPEK